MLKLNDIDGIEENCQNYKYERNKGVVSIRREQREETFCKRRKVDCIGDKKQGKIHGSECEVQQIQHYDQNTSDNYEQLKVNDSSLIILDPRFSTAIYEIASQRFTLDMLDDLVTCIKSDDHLQVMLGVMGLRRIVSCKDVPPVQQVIDTGIVPLLLQLSQKQEFPQIRLESIWTLTNIAAGSTDQCSTIIQHQGLPILLGLLNCEYVQIVEQAIWALGNLASDSIAIRDQIIEIGTIQVLKALLVRIKEKGLLNCQSINEEACWCLGNLLRGHTRPEYAKIKDALPLISVMISSGNIRKEDILSDCLWAISNHCSPTTNDCNFIIESHLIEKLMPILLQTSNYSILFPGTRIIGNLSSGSCKFTNLMIEHNVLDLLQKCMRSNRSIVRRQASWILSNFTAGNKSHILSILKKESFIQLLVEMFESDSIEIRKELCYVFANMVHGGKDLELDIFFLKFGIVQNYIDLLKEDDYELVCDVLDTFNHILRMGELCRKRRKEDTNQIVMELYRNNGIDILQRLQQEGSQQVYDRLAAMLPYYFQLQDPLEMKH